MSDSLDVKLDIAVSVSSAASPFDLGAAVTVRKPDGSSLSTHEVPLTKGENQESKGTLELELKKDDVQLWWPVGYGAQPLYTVDVEIHHVSKEGSSSSSALATKSQRLGLRRVKVIQDPLEGQEGLSFLFEVNNVRIFAGGSNW